MLTPHAISAFPSEPPPPRGPEPEDRPTPRQELIAAQLLSRGEPLPVAARMAGLRPEQLERLCTEPGFRDLREHCDATLARPVEERRARLEGLFHLALEHALAEGRVGAIAAAMRLLGLVAPRPPGGGGRGGEAKGVAEEPPPSGERWGLVPHGEHGWATPDGRPAMPGRELDVIDAAGGPARILETFEFVAYGNDLVDSFDRMPPDEVHKFNVLAYPGGGLQWDPVTRTLWHWQGNEPPDAFLPPEQRAARKAAARLAEPTPAALPKSKPEAPVPEPPTERQLLKARLDRLLATGMATSLEDVDLAEAVCAELWPNWPRYECGIDPWHVRDVLRQTRLKPGDLARLGGEACSRPQVQHGRRRRQPARPRSPPS
jgi:hypothetical protein